MILLDIEMPENCLGCPCYGGISVFCGARPSVDGVYVRHRGKGRPDWCPLVEIGSPNGRSNFDRITASPEVLAKFIFEAANGRESGCEYCLYEKQIPCPGGGGSGLLYYESCIKGIVEWLNQEVG